LWTSQEIGKCLVFQMDAHQVKTNANLEELMAAMEASAVRMEANQEKLKATDLEVNPEETEAAVETIRALKDRHLAVRRHGWPKKQTQGNGGSGRSWPSPRMVDPLRNSCSAQGTQSSGTKEGQCCKRSP
jgi:hypothetical protein